MTWTGVRRHWGALVGSEALAGLGPMARHQRVYATLGQTVHTDDVDDLSMKTYTPAEWAAQNN